MKNPKVIIVGILVILGVLALLFVKGDGTAEESVSEFGFESVNAVEFSKLTENNDVFLLDVHIPEQEHIPGTDAFIPFNEISENTEKLPQDKDTQILVYCRSGSMSRQAAFVLAEMGYTKVVDLEGGINAYREANVEVSITPNNQDLGTVIYGDVPTTEFTLTNFTPQKLNITKVSTSCGCTSAEVAEKSLEPYESTAVKVSFDPAVHGDDTDLGNLTRTIYIETDNPNFGQVSSTITANVIKN